MFKRRFVEKIPYQKPSTQISVTKQHPESTSKGPDQRRRSSIKDDLGSTSWIKGWDGWDGRDGGDEGFVRVSLGFL